MKRKSRENQKVRDLYDGSHELMMLKQKDNEGIIGVHSKSTRFFYFYHSRFFNTNELRVFNNSKPPVMRCFYPFHFLLCVSLSPSIFYVIMHSSYGMPTRLPGLLSFLIETFYVIQLVLLMTAIAFVVFNLLFYFERFDL